MRFAGTGRLPGKVISIVIHNLRLCSASWAIVASGHEMTVTAEPRPGKTRKCPRHTSHFAHPGSSTTGCPAAPLPHSELRPWSCSPRSLPAGLIHQDAVLPAPGNSPSSRGLCRSGPRQLDASLSRVTGRRTLMVLLNRPPPRHLSLTARMPASAEPRQPSHGGNQQSAHICPQRLDTSRQP